MEDINSSMTTFPLTSDATPTNEPSSQSFNTTPAGPLAMVTDAYNLSSTSAQNLTDADCLEWKDAQNLLLHSGCLVMALGFLAPLSFRHHVVLSRGGMAAGGVILILWGSTVVCQLDVLIWNLVICLVNVGHVGYWFYRTLPDRLPKDTEELYTKLFKPLCASSAQFKELIDACAVEDLPCGGTYAVEGATPMGTKLSVLLSGRLKVTCDNLFLHSIESSQFVDSVEYDAMLLHPSEDATDTVCFQVSIRAVENSRIATWQTETLRDLLQERPYFQCLLSNLVGKDITHKLYQVQEMLLSHPQYLRILAGRNTVTQFHHSIDYGLSTHSSNNSNGILRQTSPDSTSSSAASRTGVGQSQIYLTALPPITVRTPSQISLETTL